MTVTLYLGINEIKESDLVDIYRLFCKAYEIEVTDRDERFMRKQGLDCLRSLGGLDYRPYMGAKFFGQRIGKTIQFHGYSEPEDPGGESKDKQFEELVLQHFNKKS